MLTYKSVLGEIRCCEGEIITIIKDSSAINDDFISLLANDLKEYFNIQYSYDNLSDEKNLVIINYAGLFEEYSKSGLDRMEDYINNKNYNYNLTSIIIREYAKTSNTDIFGMESVTSSLVLLLFKNKIKVLKSRFSKSNDKRIMNITSIVRKFKLQKLNQLL